jgi:hypothetical protein
VPAAVFCVKAPECVRRVVCVRHVAGRAEVHLGAARALPTDAEKVCCRAVAASDTLVSDADGAAVDDAQVVRELVTHAVVGLGSVVPLENNGVGGGRVGRVLVAANLQGIRFNFI